MTASKFYSTKFTVALLFALALCAGLFMGLLDGATFNTGATLVLGVYAASDITHSLVNNNNGQPARDSAAPGGP